MIVLRKKLRSAQGFTVVELLTSIAIVAVLASVALSFGINAYRGMVLRELDAAATELAHVAQNEMTALKVGGLWLETIDSIDEAQARYLPPSAPADDLYYMTAQEAKELGIIPELSLDFTVRDGDYIIEYSRSTATVYSVFFADGRTGAFYASPTATTAAGDYYAALASPAGRDHTARLQTSPLVGYYQGTPPGATDTVALEKPVIWIDERTGSLCIQNPNLTNTAAGATWATDSLLKVTLTKEGGGASSEVSFSLDTLNKVLSTYEIEATGLTSFTRSNQAEISLFSRDALTAKDSFRIDLYQLLGLMSAHSEEYASIASQFGEGVRTRIKAEVRAPANSPVSMPATASAVFVFPGETARLTLAVTNPDYREPGVARPSHINQDSGAYLAPQVSIITKSGSTPTKHITEAAPKVFGLAGTDAALSGENPQAAYQAYTGGYVTVSEIDHTMLLEAQVGGYTPTGSTGHQSYGISELWVAGASHTRIGYLENEQWQWEYAGYGSLNSADTNAIVYGWNVSSAQTATMMDATAIHLDPERFIALCASHGIEPDSAGSYTVYLRTAPRASSVQAFYETTTPASALGAGLTASVRETSSAASAIRKQIETQFGAASSVALLTISRAAGGANGENSGIADFPTGRASNIWRIYYSYTPAIAFAGAFDQDTLKLEQYRPQNTMLWFNNNNVMERPARVQHHRNGEWPEDIYLTLNGSVFALPHQQDPLFYRALFYYEEDRATLVPSSAGMPNPQYSPYTNQQQSVIQQFNKPSTSVWFTNNVYAYPDLSTTAATGQTISTYDVVFAAGRVNLYYASVGLLYMEFNGYDPTAYYGYLDGGTATITNTLSPSNVITNWGYYAVVPSGSPAPTATFSRYESETSYVMTVPVGTSPITFSEGGFTYQAYRLNSNHTSEDAVLTTLAPNPNHTRLIYPQRMDCSFNGSTKTNYLNVLFAATVNKTKPTGNNDWGSSSKPYQVRHADQLFGYLPRVYWSNTVPLEDYYYDSWVNYSQTHSFSMSGYQNLGNPKFYPQYEQWFAGVYDGNNFEITDYTLTPTVNNATEGAPRGRAGLFPHIYYSGVIKNVHMRNATGTVDTATIGSAEHRVGLLVGFALENCTIENCSVSDSTVSTRMGSTSAPGDQPQFGGLVGTVWGRCKIIDCSTSNLSFTVDLGTVTPQTLDINIGGLLGEAYVYNTISGCRATNTTVNVLVRGRNIEVADQLEVGGLIGRIYDYNQVLNNSVSGGVVNVNVEGGSAILFNSLDVGGLIGRTYTYGTVSGCSVTNTDITINGASYNAVARSTDNRIERIRCGGLIGMCHYTYVNNNTLNNIDIIANIPGGRIGSATGDSLGYSGFGVLAGYSEATTTYGYDGNVSRTVTFDLNWVGSTTSARNGVGDVIGWAYPGYPGTIYATTTSDDINKTTRDANNVATTENVDNDIGITRVP